MSEGVCVTVVLGVGCCGVTCIEESGRKLMLHDEYN